MRNPSPSWRPRRPQKEQGTPARAGTRKAAVCGNVAAYLFRPPAGLADGLALKELALPPRKGNSPQLLVPPLRFPRLQGGFQIRRGRQASRPALSILPSASDVKTFTPTISAPGIMSLRELCPRPGRRGAPGAARACRDRPRRRQVGDRVRGGVGALRPSGEPKPIRHGQRYLYGQRVQAEHWFGARAGDLCWCTAASGWSKSARNVFVAPWLRGATALLHDRRFDPGERLAVVERERVNVLCMAPTEWRTVAKHIEIRPLPSPRHAVAAGEPPNPETGGLWGEGVG